MTDDAATPPLPPLTPEDRALTDEPSGTPTVLADGQIWILADYVPVLGGVWDTLYDHRIGRGKYAIADLRTAAVHLVRANYAATPAECYDLLLHADPTGLLEAVEAALLPMPGMSAERTWSRWVESALWAGGLDPAHIPARIRNEVLEHLERSGRVIPRTEWIGSHRAAASRAQLTAHAAERAAAAASGPPADS